MTEQESKEIRVGETILGHGSNPSLWNHVRAGFRVLAVLPNGLQVRRIHEHYLREGPVESWTLRWDQLLSFIRLPVGSQIPLL